MSLGRTLGEHWQIKLLAVVFAVVLWAFVASEDKGEAVYTVPVDVTVPPGLEVTSLGVEMVDVRLEGLRHVLARLQEHEIRADVRVREARPGEVVVRIGPGDVSVPRGVRVVRVTPSRVRLMLEPADVKPAPRAP
jgi:YbbR domain-containing protein